MNSMLNNFMSDPFSQQANSNSRQQTNNRSNQMSVRNNFDPFGNSMSMSPFEMHHNSVMAHHQQAMNNQNPFALMNQMMSNSFSNNVFNNFVTIFKYLFFKLKLKQFS